MIVLPLRDLREWVSRAKHGDRIQYIHDVLSLDGSTGDAAETRDAAYALYEIGKVALFQARNECGTFDYLIERISPNTADLLDRISQAITVRRK